MFKVNNKDTRKTPVTSLLFFLNMFHTLSSVSIVDFQKGNIFWVSTKKFMAFCL